MIDVGAQLKRSPKFVSKRRAHKRLITDAADLIQILGVPIDKLTARALEKMAMAFLAVANVRQTADWNRALDVTSDDRSLKTRDIIQYENAVFGEDISMGSYDDIRRKDLKLLVAAGIVVSTSPDSARNNPQRGYAINAAYASVIRKWGQSDWAVELAGFMSGRVTLTDELAGRRELAHHKVLFPDGSELALGPGLHNTLQKSVIEELLARYGYGAEVLYVGDAESRHKLYERDRLTSLGFVNLDHEKLPDVIAYSPAKHWLFMIEAVCTSGPISPLRLAELKRLAPDCPVDVVYVTAFLDRATFRKFIGDIAWETEVWIAEEPDHLIHFNGEKFLGPHAICPDREGRQPRDS